MIQEITIGRSRQCDIVVADDRVSAIHARISICGNHYVYEDMSSNGTTVNGEYVNARRVEVAYGADVRLAGHLPLPWDKVHRFLPVDRDNRAGGTRPVRVPQQPVRTPGRAAAPLPAAEPAPNFGWAVLCFFFPIAGWILYGVWRRRLPRRARMVWIAAWTGFGTGIFLNLICLAATA